MVEWITAIAALFLSAQLNCIYSIKAQKYVPLPPWALLTTDGKMLSFLGLLGEVLEGEQDDGMMKNETQPERRDLSLWTDVTDRAIST